MPAQSTNLHLVVRQQVFELHRPQLVVGPDDVEPPLVWNAST